MPEEADGETDSSEEGGAWPEWRVRSAQLGLPGWIVSEKQS